LGNQVTDLVTEVRRVLGVDVEVRAARPVAAGWTGAEHLDRFADVVADYAHRPAATVDGLLAYLEAAAVVENGLAPADITVAEDRVQILTVHAAKGLEWQVVAVPHLSARVFPSTASKRTWLSDPADLPPLLRGDRAAGGLHGVPVLDISSVSDRKGLSDSIIAHRDQLEQRRIDEERRLLYVAITRAEETLLLSGHHWGATESKPRGPSDFLCEVKDIIDSAAAAGSPCGQMEHWAPDPADGERNPLRDSVRQAIWPADPLGRRRADVERGAALVAAAAAGALPHSDDDPEGWAPDVDALLAERSRIAQPPPAELPGQLSVSALVDLHRDPATAARRLTRRLPSRPDPHAILGTAFHEWVQRFYGAERLFDLDDLPGAVDDGPVETERLAALQEAFAASPWAARTPIDVEVPFEMAIGDTIVRGRIDAVFADPDGGTTVVDWKTGEPPADEEARRHAAVQLAVYRLAWAALSGQSESTVRAAFHYVRSGQTVVPENLPGPTELVALLVAASSAERCA
jgi:DNA helicase-2/ATP-dependent DNA helicase PcrA